MNTNLKYLATTALVASAMPFVSLADDLEYRSHAPHVHGEAKLTIALEGNTLEINLETRQPI